MLKRCCKIGLVTTPPEPILDSKCVARVRRALTEAAYTAPQIEAAFERPMLDLINSGNHGNLAELASGDEPQHTLIRLLLAGRDERETDVASTGLPVEALIDAGVLQRVDDATVRAKIRIQPHGQWWALTDMPVWHNGYQGSDTVVAVGPPSVTVANYVLRDKVDTALDIGTGCGVQALHLSEHATAVTATDLSRRALRFAATTAGLNDMRWELRHGDLVAPVADRRFDLVVCAPPMSVGPGLGRWLFRDSSEPGDAIVARLAAAAPRLLTDGGVMQFIADWPEPEDRDWQDYLATWIAPGLDAWITRLGGLDAEAYVDSWMTADPDDAIDREKWLRWLHNNKIGCVGRGLVTLRRSGRPVPAVRIETSSPRPSGVEVGQWISGRDWMRDQDWRSHTYRIADDVTARTRGKSLDLQKIYNMRVFGGPLRWSVRGVADGGGFELFRHGRALAATGLAVDICGEATRSEPRRMGDLLDALERRSGLDSAEFRHKAAEAVTRLLERGILVPASMK